MHLAKEGCRYGNRCKSLHNVQHRVRFHHPGKWDVLLPCRDGSRCINKHPKHLEQYYHEPIKFVVTDEKVERELVGGSPSESSGISGRDGLGEIATGSAAGAAAAAAAATSRRSSYGSQRQLPQPEASRSLDFGDIQGSVQEDMDDIGDIYNEDAISGMYGDALSVALTLKTVTCIWGQ